MIRNIVIPKVGDDPSTRRSIEYAWYVDSEGFSNVTHKWVGKKIKKIYIKGVFGSLLGDFLIYDSTEGFFWLSDNKFLNTKNNEMFKV